MLLVEPRRCGAELLVRPLFRGPRLLVEPRRCGAELLVRPLDSERRLRTSRLPRRLVRLSALRRGLRSLEGTPLVRLLGSLGSLVGLSWVLG